MTSSLQAALLAGTAALAVALGAMAAHAGDYTDLLAAEQAAAVLDAATGRDNLITEAVEAAAAEGAADALLEAVGDLPLE